MVPYTFKFFNGSEMATQILILHMSHHTLLLKSLNKFSFLKTFLSNHLSRPRLYLTLSLFTLTQSSLLLEVHFFTFTFTWSFLLHFIFPGQGHINKVSDTPSFLNSFHIQPELRTILLCILKHCCSMSEMRLKQNTTLPNIAWLPFYLQEHKSHNNVSLVMEHLSLLW